MEDKIFQVVVEQDELSWKTIIMDLINKEGMSPWDVDIGLLADKYIDRVSRLKEVNLKLGGKVLLCAALLLRLKSVRLLGEDMQEFDRLLQGEPEPTFYDDLEQELKRGEEVVPDTLSPRMPCPRKRKVSVFDLVKALEKALEVKHRRIERFVDVAEVHRPDKKFDVTTAMSSLFDRIVSFFVKKEPLTFTKLCPSKDKEDKIYSFIPLLHLSNQQKVTLEQKETFGEIEIKEYTDPIYEEPKDEPRKRRASRKPSAVGNQPSDESDGRGQMSDGSSAASDGGEPMANGSSNSQKPKPGDAIVASSG